MKLHPAGAVPLTEGETAFRTSPLAMAVFAAVLAAAPVAAVTLWLTRGGLPWGVRAIAVVCALLFLVFAPAARRGFGRDNWILRLRPEGLALNIRSHWNAGLSGEDAVVAMIARQEVKGVRRVAGRRVVPGLSGRGRDESTAEEVVCLDVLLAHERTEELAEALRRERAHRGRGRAHFQHYPVRLVAPDCIRVTWRDRRGRVVPGIERALEVLSGSLLRLEHVELDQRSWRELEGGDLDGFVLELVESGDTMEAVKVLRLRHGWDLARAKTFVDDLRAA